MAHEKHRALPALALALLASGACSRATSTASTTPMPASTAASRTTDPRVGLKAGRYDAGEAAWNMRLLSNTPSTAKFEDATNSDLSFTGNYAIQGSYNGWQIWDISTPTKPSLVTAYYCPASQSDVSVYKNLLFVSGEGLSGRLDCGDQGVQAPVSKDRLRGLRIFDITDIRNPKNVGNVQTCRGSHTHTVLVDPKDTANVYVYISGSSAVRSADELPGCVSDDPSKNANSALFRIEVIKVPVANPAAAAIVSSPRIFNDLKAPPRHGATAAERAETDSLIRSGAFIVDVEGEPYRIGDRFTRPLLDSIAKAAGRTTITAADTAALRPALQAIINKRFGLGGEPTGPTQCHDITVYPAIGLAGGACEGYGLLLDISDPANPKRIAAVADSNFSYWHSATFNNDGSKVLFTDEWGGGGEPKCRSTDPLNWGADAIFTRTGTQLQFQSYYKMAAPQTPYENCVAHNGSLIPIPGRDVMVQSWYQGGVSVFDFTDAKHPMEIAYHDRGPVEAGRMGNAGTWSVYWYNGVLVSSEIGRGLDVFELQPSAFVSKNEIDAAKTVKFTYLNPQGQPRFTWPASFALARAYVDQLERSKGLSSSRIAAIRTALTGAESASGSARGTALTTLATQIDGEASGADAAKVRMLAQAVRDLAR